MKTTYLKAEDEASMIQALLDAGVYVANAFIDENDQEAYECEIAPGYEYSDIGLIWKPTGETQEVVIGGETSIEPIMLPVEGWHGNLRGDLTDEQKAVLPIIPDPVTPERIFAD